MIEATHFTTSADGTEIFAEDYGAGAPIVIVHGGLGAAENWQAVGELLAKDHRIVAIERRVYGRSGTPRLPHSMAREAEDIVAVLERIGQRAIIVGHSSGGIATLEAALTHPPTLAGIVLYEPPVQLDQPIGGDSQAEAEAAVARGDRSAALRIFFSGFVGLPPQAIAYMAESPEFAGGWGEMQRLVPAQMEDNRGIRALPLGVARFAHLDIPVLLLRGSDSPPHLHDRLEALKAVIPDTREATLVGENHTANLTAPGKVAEVLAGFARAMLA